MQRSALIAAAAVMLAAPLAAQSAPVTRDDSLRIPRRYVEWAYLSATDSLWNRFGNQLRQVLGGRDRLQGWLDRIVIELGAESGVIEETVATRGGNLVYTREATFENLAGDTGVWQMEIAPDGTIVMGGLQPKSRMAPPQAQADSAAK